MYDRSLKVVAFLHYLIFFWEHDAQSKQLKEYLDIYFHNFLFLYNHKSIINNQNCILHDDKNKHTEDH